MHSQFYILYFYFYLEFVEVCVKVFIARCGQHLLFSLSRFILGKEKIQDKLGRFDELANASLCLFLLLAFFGHQEIPVLLC
ncbi:unnamed protein product [Linum trigynum]|uniref:Uncharacterized protein n=1 Tax=Linum trigynum TaxID=586398 RepID=A0AAV2C7M4_9ROSI